jgi:DNA-binding NarL/FixJ family response regulator
MKVFIVDDSKIVRNKLTSLLSEHDGVQIVGQASGCAEALALIPVVQPDVVTLDIRMPDGCGLDIIRSIKTALARITVIMLTNYPLACYEQECRERGADFFLDKSREFGRIPEILAGLERGTAPKDRTNS